MEEMTFINFEVTAYIALGITINILYDIFINKE